MPKPKTAKEIGIEGYKLRIVLPNVVLWLLSATEPVVYRDTNTGAVERLRWDSIDGTQHGDTLGYIRWSEVTAISWRKL